MNIYRDVILFGFYNFYAEMFFAILILMRRTPRRPYFRLRAGLLFAASAAVYFLPDLRAGVFNFDYLIVAALVLAESLFCYKTSFFNALFYTLGAFALQHIGWNVLQTVVYAVGPDKFNRATGIACYAASYAAAYTAAWFLFSVKHPPEAVSRRRVVVLLVSALILVVTYFTSAMLSAVNGWNVYCRIYAIICCIFSLCTQFGIFRAGGLQSENERLSRDKVILEELLYREKKQQELMKKTIEIIERKCLELRNRISALRTLDKEDRERAISEMEKAVMIYGNIARTSNAVLNVVLTEKGLLCEKYNIRFTYIVDGDTLSFMDPADLSSLFGNAIDNAIESVVREEDDEKRIIRLHVAQRNELLGIHVENYCGSAVRFENGLPVSDRADKSCNGFGVKRIRYIAEKYGGYVNAAQENHMFNLNILFPRTAAKRG